MELLTRLPLSSPSYELDSNLNWLNCYNAPAAAIVGSQGLMLARFDTSSHHTSYLISHNRIRTVAISDSLVHPLIATLQFDGTIVIYEPSSFGWVKLHEIQENDVKLISITWCGEHLVAGDFGGKLFLFSFTDGKECPRKEAPQKSRGRGRRATTQTTNGDQAADKDSGIIRAEHRLPSLTNGLCFISTLDESTILVGSKSGRLFTHDIKSYEEVNLWSEDDDVAVEKALLLSQEVAVMCKATFLVVVKGNESKSFPSLCKMKVTGMAKICSPDESSSDTAHFLVSSLEERLVLCKVNLKTLQLDQEEIASEVVKDRSNYKGLASSPFGVLFCFSQTTASLTDKSTTKPNNIFLYSTQSFESVCSWLSKEESNCQAPMSQVLEYIYALKFLLTKNQVAPEQRISLLPEQLECRSLSSLKITKHKLALSKDFYTNADEVSNQLEKLLPPAAGRDTPCPVCKSKIARGATSCSNQHSFQRCPKSGELCDPGQRVVKQCILCNILFTQSDSYFVCSLCF